VALRSTAPTRTTSKSTFDVAVLVVVDGALDLSATLVDHVDERTVIIFVSIATTPSRSSIPRS